MVGAGMQCWRAKYIPGAPLEAALALHSLSEQCAEGCNGQCEQWRRSAADVFCGAGMPKLRAASIAQLHGASCGEECVRIGGAARETVVIPGVILMLKMCVWCAEFRDPHLFRGVLGPCGEMAFPRGAAVALQGRPDPEADCSDR